MKDNRYSLVLLISIIALLVSIINISNNSFASPTNTIYTRDELSERITDNELFLKSYPVGSIYITTNSENPGDIYGGTWVSYGNGRTLVGLDSNQTEFDEINKEGGEKTHLLTPAEMPSHNHIDFMFNNQPDYGTTIVGGSAYFNYINYSTTVIKYTSENILNKNKWKIGETSSSGLSQSHNNLQPYIVVNMWKRTA